MPILVDRVRTTTLAALSAALALTAAPAAAQLDRSGEARSDATDNGQVIATFYYSNSTHGYDGDGDKIDIADYQKLELYLLTELDIMDDLTVVFTPSFRDISVEGPGNDSSGLGYVDLGARYKVAKGDAWSFALQGTARIPGDKRRDVLAQVGSSDPEYDFRARYVHGFTVGEDNAFVDLQGSYRFRDGGPPNEFHADVTFGYRPNPGLLLMAQSFNTFSDGAGKGIFDSYRYHNVQLSAVQDIAENVAIQAGGLATLGGENALRERGAFGGIWFGF